MSDVGSIAIDDGGFSGPSYSQDLATKIDAAIRSISDEGYTLAIATLMANRPCLDKIAEELAEIETMSGARLREIVAEFTPIPDKMAAV
mmetsp:Transcript_34440/g.112058  ORF Transcript_34440/g.112058 Transcript_34440/m.112058 type:complete len:89 (+) Transcript_34440:1-267(+)